MENIFRWPVLRRPAMGACRLQGRPPERVRREVPVRCRVIGRLHGRIHANRQPTDGEQRAGLSVACFGRGRGRDKPVMCARVRHMLRLAISRCCYNSNKKAKDQCACRVHRLRLDKFVAVYPNRRHRPPAPRSAAPKMVTAAAQTTPRRRSSHDGFEYRQRPRPAKAGPASVIEAAMTPGSCSPRKIRYQNVTFRCHYRGVFVTYPFAERTVASTRRQRAGPCIMQPAIGLADRGEHRSPHAPRHQPVVRDQFLDQKSLPVTTRTSRKPPCT